MNWLLSATPGAADASQGGSKKTGARGASSRDDGGSIKVSLVPNEDGSDAVERGATLKHFLSRKAESLTPKFGANGSGRLTSVPSFTQSELNLLLNALGRRRRRRTRLAARRRRVDDESIQRFHAHRDAETRLDASHARIPRLTTSFARSFVLVVVVIVSWRVTSSSLSSRTTMRVRHRTSLARARRSTSRARRRALGTPIARPPPPPRPCPRARAASRPRARSPPRPTGR